MLNDRFKFLENFLMHCRLSPEGMSNILAVLGAALTLTLFLPQWIGVWGGAAAFAIFTFRNPVRNCPKFEDTLYAPSDGVVVDIEEVGWDPQGTEDSAAYLCVGVFLSLLSVHVQRVPFRGTVAQSFSRSGSHHTAMDLRARTQNAFHLTVLQTESGKVTVKQIAGLITRKVICGLSSGQEVLAGDRLGVIIFGSRVELYFDKRYFSLSVIRGERVTGGITEMARQISRQPG